MKKILTYLLPLVVAGLFILYPLNPSPMKIRFYFDDYNGEDCLLYYATATSPQLEEGKCLKADYNAETGVATFTLDSHIVKGLTTLRLDFPPTSQLFSIYDISVSSAGVVKNRFHPCDFFAEENVAVVNDIDGMSYATALAKVFFQTGVSDPYVLFSGNLMHSILRCNSQYRLSRLLVCLLIFAGFLIWKKKLFVHENPREVSI